MGCAVYIRCALSIHQKEFQKVWGARYTSVRVIYRKIRYLNHSQNYFRIYLSFESLLVT
jgi:hypothetical protein